MSRRERMGLTGGGGRNRAEQAIAEQDAIHESIARLPAAQQERAWNEYRILLQVFRAQVDAQAETHRSTRPGARGWR